MGRAIDATMYRNSAALGSGYGTPTHNLVDCIADLDVPWVKEKQETTRRSGRGIKTFDPTIEEVSIKGKMLVPPIGAAAGNVHFDDYQAFKTAWGNNGVLDLLFLDDLITTVGAEGFRGAFKLVEWSQPQGNADRLWRMFELCVSDWDVATLASGASPGAENVRKALVGTGPAVTYASLGSNTYA